MGLEKVQNSSHKSFWTLENILAELVEIVNDLIFEIE